MSSARLLRGLAARLARSASQAGASTSGGAPCLAATQHWQAVPAAQRRWESTLPATTVARPAPPTRRLLVDTLDMMRRFERLGMTRAQAEDLTEAMTDLLCTNRDRLAESYVPWVSLEKAVLETEAKLAALRAEVLRGQELGAAAFTRDAERLQANLEKVRSEIRYEVDKLTASQRLDLNLEKGRMRDELQAARDKANELDIKVDKEVNSLKAAMEQSKNDTVKYVLGLVLALMTAALGAARLVMH